MKSMRSLLAAGFLSAGLTMPAAFAHAVDVAASALLGGSPYAVEHYGSNMVKGRAMLASSQYGSNTQIVVKMSGLKPGTAHIGHIHAGTCARLIPGTILHNLEPVVADSAGTGTSKTTINEGMQGLTDCEWWIAVHEGPENTTPQSPALAVGPVITKGQARD